MARMCECYFSFAGPRSFPISQVTVPFVSALAAATSPLLSCLFVGGCTSISDSIFAVLLKEWERLDLIDLSGMQTLSHSLLYCDWCLFVDLYNMSLASMSYFCLFFKYPWLHDSGITTLSRTTLLRFRKATRKTQVYF